MRVALSSLSTRFQSACALWLIAAIASMAAAQQPATMSAQRGPALQSPAAATTPQSRPSATPAAPAAQPAEKSAEPAIVVPPKPPIIHSLSFPEPATHVILVKSAIPTDGRESIELMMSVWSPGFYKVENYAAKVKNFAVQTPLGEPLTFEKTADNRWRINNPQHEPVVAVSYRLDCVPDSPSAGRELNHDYAGGVSHSAVNREYAVICGGPTYMTLVDDLDRPHEVRLNMPPQWTKSATGLALAPDSYAHHYWAKNFDTLIDSPIALGNLSIHDFQVDGSRHHLVDIGDAADFLNWDGGKQIVDLQKMVQETRNFWGFLPFSDYYFLNKITGTRGGGLEHLNSTLIHTTPPRRPSESRETHLRWLNFVAHEYFHAFNVKRLRPIELGPFDYEHARKTSGLWVAEGLTNYFNSLIVVRAGLCTTDEYLANLSGHIGKVQRSPGRLVQSLAASSLETWSGDGFGGSRDQSVDYYEKGPVVGLLLDAKIRRATDNKKSLDDVMRLAYSRYSGAKGYTEQEFLDTAQEVAGISLKEFFDKNLFSTDELDYTEALDWLGLRFAPSESEQPSWKLEVLPESTEDQKAHLASYLAPSKAPVEVMAKKEEPKAAPAPATVAKADEAAKPGEAAKTTEPPKAAPLIDGVGGVFIFSNDPARLAQWYEKSLGLETTKQPDGAFVLAFNYRKDDNPNEKTKTVWAVLPATDGRAEGPNQFQVNYRVPDMGKMVSHLRAGGVEIEKAQNYPWGRFVWLRDPDGNRVELFQPLDQ